MGDFIEYQTTRRGADFYRKARQWGSYRTSFVEMDEAFVEPPKPVPDRKTVIRGLLGVMAEMDEIKESRAA